MNQQYKFYTTLPIIFGELFSIYRKKLHLTQKDFSEALGVGTANISKIEAGDTVISIEQLFAISLFVNKAPSDILETIDLILDSLKKNGILVISTKLNKALSDKSKNIELLKLTTMTGPIGWAIYGLVFSKKLYKNVTRKSLQEPLQDSEINTLSGKPLVKGSHIHPYIMEIIESNT